MEIRGASGGTWSLVHQGGAWSLFAGTAEASEVARISLDEETAWRVFFKALPADAPPAIHCEGRADLCRAFRTAWAVMA